ncbi:MAG: O-antigen ligase family protein [Phycisphaerae bacterium]|nr:O-antigen ligase family protein [Phycisphaerae bacterium]
MLAATHTRLPLLLLLLLLATAALLLILPAQLGPYAHLVWLGLAVIVALLVWLWRGNFVHGVLVWLILTAFFPGHFWRLDLPGFFNVTIGRIAIVILGLLFLLRSFLRGLPRLPVKIVALMIILTAYFAFSAWRAGWTLTISAAPPYYRLFVGYVFPFTAFVFTLAGFPRPRNAAQTLDPRYYQRLITGILWIFFAFGVYLTFTAFCERFELWSLVWPRFIADPNAGLNFGRARGPFAEAFAMALTLTFLFFVNLFLAKRSKPPLRIFLWMFNLPVLLAIYFTYTRTGYVCLLVCAVLWIWLVAGRLRRSAALALISAILLAAVALNWAIVSGKERTAGGLAEMRPIVGRLAVSKLALELTAEHPFFGVGFGHYRQAVLARHMDLTGTTGIYARHLSQSVAVLSVLCETGLLGLALYLALFFAILVPSIRLYRRLPRRPDGFVWRDFVVLFWVLYLQTTLMSITSDPSYYPYTTGLLMFFAALIAGLNFVLPENIQPEALPGGLTSALKA